MDQPTPAHPVRWLITGVSSGLGRALAEAALRRGDHVAGTVRSEAARAAFTAIAPGRSIGMTLEITDHHAVRSVVVAAEAELGRIDILVNNAGYGLVGGVEEASMAEIRAQFEVNLFGPVALMQAALPAMRARRAGRILNVSSVSGLVGWPSLGIYSGSKFALEGISETLALELAPLGIKLTLIEPGGLRTDFAGRSRTNTARRIAEYDATVGESRRILAAHAGHETGSPEKAAEAMLAIADHPSPPLRILLGSDALGYVTGKFAAESEAVAEWASFSRSIDS